MRSAYRGVLAAFVVGTVAVCSPIWTQTWVTIYDCFPRPGEELQPLPPGSKCGTYTTQHLGPFCESDIYKSITGRD